MLLSLLCRHPKDTKPKSNNLKSKKASSFQEFAQSTNDAWDIDDEDDEDLLLTSAPSAAPPGAPQPSPQPEVTLTLNAEELWPLNLKSKTALFRLINSRMGVVTLGWPTDWDRLTRNLCSSRSSRRRRTKSASMLTERSSGLQVTHTLARPQVWLLSQH